MKLTITTTKARVELANVFLVTGVEGLKRNGHNESAAELEKFRKQLVKAYLRPRIF